MKIALHVFGEGDHPGTGRPQAALLQAGCEALGWPCRICTASAEILDFAPDLVLSLTMAAPKLTALPTVAVLWDHAPRLEAKAAYIRYLLSCDGLVVPDAAAARYVRDILHAARKSCPVAEAPFSSVRQPRPAAPGDAALMVEAADLSDAWLMPLMHLADRLPLAVYGPADPWAALGSAWRGEADTPFAERLARHGRYLHPGTPEERERGVPAPHFFQAVAMGAPTIAGAHPWIAAHFGDAVALLPEAAAAMRLIDAVADAAARPTPGAAARAADRFAREMSVESLLTRLAPPAPLPSPCPETRVDYIVRAGGRPAAVLARALAALAAQTHRAIRPIVVVHHAVEGLAEMLSGMRQRFPDLTVIDIAPAPVRSRALWAGLRAVEADYFGILDDDDSLHPEHVASLLAVLRRGGARLAYSGAVRVIEAQATPGRSARHAENRDLAFLEPFSPGRIARANYIVSNAWLARRELLDADVLDAPDLDTGEDFLLLLELLERTGFAPSWRPTAEFFWREDAADHSRRDPGTWRESMARTRRRLMFSRIMANALEAEWPDHGSPWEADFQRFVPLVARRGDTLAAVRARHPGHAIAAAPELIARVSADDPLDAGTDLRVSVDPAAPARRPPPE
ncbi:glycosyltransferase family 2 protein [Oleispirillum naphthae]|uniref:glycosyltransferase family 2 protein n=1 Tax=Oleispirillum naphthae TaxID=2838853 RepID=UPI0030825BAA